MQSEIWEDSMDIHTETEERPDRLIGYFYSQGDAA